MATCVRVAMYYDFIIMKDILLIKLRLQIVGTMLCIYICTYTCTYVCVCVNMCRGDELLLTEMIFNGAFNDLTIEQCVSLLSCFVFQEKVSMITYIHI